jgi:hypothetical protein
MDKVAMLGKHLAQVEEHVALGDRHLSRQREIIARLARGGHDTAAAVALLKQFEEIQELHCAHRDRLIKENWPQR